MRRITANVASEPFLNRKVPLAVAGSLAGLALLATALNLTIFLVRGGQYRAHRATLRGQQEKLQTLNRRLSDQKKLLEGPEVERYASEAGFIRWVLDGKRFSWTVFLDEVEKVKPYGVMVTDLSPRLDPEGRVLVSLRGVANPRDEVLKFENNLFASHCFRGAELTSENKDSTNAAWTRFDLTFEYLPPGGAP